METWRRTALWAQFGAAIDTLEHAVVACPDALWTERLWRVPADDPVPADIAAYWYLAFHALFWLDCYLSGATEGFAPPPPFTLSEFDPAGIVPDPAYTKEELLTYLAYTRRKGHATLSALTDEQARQPVTFPWTKGQPFSYFELQLYNMRHVQEHASQLLLLLGQHDIHASANWVGRAQDAPESATGG